MEIPAKTKHGTKPEFRMKRNFGRRLVSLIGMVATWITKFPRTQLAI